MEFTVELFEIEGDLLEHLKIAKSEVKQAIDDAALTLDQQFDKLISSVEENIPYAKKEESKKDTPPHKEGEGSTIQSTDISFLSSKENPEDIENAAEHDNNPHEPDT